MKPPHDKFSLLFRFYLVHGWITMASKRPNYSGVWCTKFRNKSFPSLVVGFEFDSWLKFERIHIWCTNTYLQIFMNLIMNPIPKPADRNSSEKNGNNIEKLQTMLMKKKKRMKLKELLLCVTGHQTSTRIRKLFRFSFSRVIQESRCFR